MWTNLNNIPDGFSQYSFYCMLSNTIVQTPKTRYFYPQDVKIEVVDGKRCAYVDFDLPVIWSKDAVARAKVDFLDGWDMARREYEKVEHEKWLSKYYTWIVEEKEEFKKDYTNWKAWMLGLIERGILVNTPEYRKEAALYKGQKF